MYGGLEYHCHQCIEELINKEIIADDRKTK